MTNYQIAGKIVPCALRTANMAEGSPLSDQTLIALSGILSSAVARYGYKERQKITREALKTEPAFELVSDSFFTILTETPVIAGAAHSRNYGEITLFIAEHQDMTPKQRFKLYGDEYVSGFVKFLKLFHIVCISVTVVCVLIQIGLYLFVPEIRQEFLAKYEKLKKQAEKTKKTAKLFGKIVKFVIQKLIK